MPVTEDYINELERRHGTSPEIAELRRRYTSASPMPQINIDPEVIAKKETSEIYKTVFGLDDIAINATYNNLTKDMYGEELKPSAVRQRMVDDGFILDPYAEEKYASEQAMSKFNKENPTIDVLRQRNESNRQIMNMFNVFNLADDVIFNEEGEWYNNNVANKPDEEPNKIYSEPIYEQEDLLDFETYVSLLENAETKQQVENIRNERKSLVTKLRNETMDSNSEYFDSVEWSEFSTGSKTQDVVLEATKGLYSALKTIERGAMSTSVAMGMTWNQPSIDKIDEALANAKLTPIKAAGKIGYVTRTMVEAIPNFAYNMSVGSSGIFITEYGNAKQDALNSGATERESDIVALPVATINTIIENFQLNQIAKIAGMGKGGKQAIKKIIADRAYKTFLKKGAAFTGQSIKSAINEGFEGWLQEGVSIGIPGFIIDSYPKDENGNVDWVGVLGRMNQSFVGEGLGGLFLGTSGSIYNARKVQNVKKNLAGELIINEGIEAKQALDVANNIIERLQSNDGTPKEIYANEVGKVKKADTRAKAAAHMIKKGKEIPEEQYRKIAMETTGKESMVDMTYEDGEKFIAALKNAVPEKVETKEGEVKEEVTEQQIVDEIEEIKNGKEPEDIGKTPPDISGSVDFANRENLPSDVTQEAKPVSKNTYKVYHGTPQEDEFEFDLAKASIGFNDVHGIYFSDDKDYASTYMSKDQEGNPYGQVNEYEITLNNPANEDIVEQIKNEIIDDVPSTELGVHVTFELQKRGYDGVIREDGQELIVFETSQIKKSAQAAKTQKQEVKPEIRKDVENVKIGDKAVVLNESGNPYEGEIVSLGSKNVKIKTQSSMYGEQIISLPRNKIKAFIPKDSVKPVVKENLTTEKKIRKSRKKKTKAIIEENGFSGLSTQSKEMMLKQIYALQEDIAEGGTIRDRYIRLKESFTPEETKKFQSIINVLDSVIETSKPEVMKEKRPWSQMISEQERLEEQVLTDYLVTKDDVVVSADVKGAEKKTEEIRQLIKKRFEYDYPEGLTVTAEAMLEAELEDAAENLNYIKSLVDEVKPPAKKNKNRRGGFLDLTPFGNRDKLQAKIEEMMSLVKKPKAPKKNLKALKKTDATTTVLNVAEDIIHGIDRAFGIMSTRIKNISPKLFQEVRNKYINPVKMIIADRTKKVHPFVDIINKFNEEDSYDWQVAIWKEDIDEAERLIKKYDLNKQYNVYRDVMDLIFHEGKAVGIDMEYRSSYFPSKVKDLNGLLKYLGTKEEYAPLLKVLQEAQAKKGNRTLSEDEQTQVIDTLLRGYSTTGISLTAPGFTRLRTLIRDDVELIKYYYGFAESVSRYIEDMTENIQARKFFGKQTKEITQLRANISRTKTTIAKMETSLETAEDDDISKIEGNIERAKERLKNYETELETKDDGTLKNSIGNYVLDLITSKTINFDQQVELRQIFEGLFNPKGSASWMRTLRSLEYVGSLAQISALVTQYSEIVLSAMKSPENTLPNWVKAHFNKSDIKLEDIGVAHIGQEWADADLNNKITWLMKLFEKVDKIGKETFINSVIDKYRKMAKTNPDKVKEELSKYYPESEHDSIIESLKSGAIDNNIKGFALNELADVQPISQMEVPELYAKAGNFRVFYMYKTFTLKRLDILRNRAYTDIKQGIKTDNKKLLLRGLGKLAWLAFLFSLADSTADLVKDVIRGKPIDDVPNYVVDNLLQMMMLSRYSAGKVKGQGISAFFKDNIALPVSNFDAAVRDSMTLMDEESDKGSEFMRRIPWIGDLYYWWMGEGARKVEEGYYDN